MKKLLKFFRNLLILLTWSYVFVYIMRVIFVAIWNFDFLSISSWDVLFDFWNNGGVIKSAVDVLLIFSLIFLPVLWYFSWKIVRKWNYLEIFLFPINLFYKWKDKTVAEHKNLVIRCEKSDEQKIEEIKSRIQSISKEENIQTNNIRQNIIKRRRNE